MRGSYDCRDGEDKLANSQTEIINVFVCLSRHGSMKIVSGMATKNRRRLLAALALFAVLLRVFKHLRWLNGMTEWDT